MPMQTRIPTHTRGPSFTHLGRCEVAAGSPAAALFSAGREVALRCMPGSLGAQPVGIPRRRFQLAAQRLGSTGRRRERKASGLHHQQQPRFPQEATQEPETALLIPSAGNRTLDRPAELCLARQEPRRSAAGPK